MKQAKPILLSTFRKLAVVILVFPLAACGASSEGDSKADSHTHAHTNALIEENSPYLLQHAHHPVDWHPWGDAAFEKAKRQDKPIFLSIGYSTCYWCHVMEKESFEDPEVAAILNEHYIAIKVDREERPDVDETYMLATQLVVGQGGWPNSVWLTPEGEPWMAGTYFSKKKFTEMLEDLVEIWHTRRDQVDRQAASLSEQIQQMSEGVEGYNGKPSLEMMRTVVERLNDRFDPKYGGFGPAPKFPPYGILRFLLSWSDYQGEAVPITVAETLDALWLGGIHDHIGGGFHRYSTDTEWLVPHFEKMLYDNAQLLRVYAEAAVRSGDSRYRHAVADIFSWLEREMTTPEGGFYSAIDSGEVGQEGAFYVWTMEELKDALSEEDAVLFAETYGFVKEGNFEGESTGRRTGENIPHLERPLVELARARGIEPEVLRTHLSGLRSKLLRARMERTYPHKDDKVLTGWNGLMIEALAYAGAQLERPDYTEAAARAADFLLKEMASGDTLLRSYRDGKASQVAFLDDYAYFGAGLLQLHATTGETRWLEAAKMLADTLLKSFQDEAKGGFFLARDSADVVLARSKALQNSGNLPSVNGVAAQMLIELGRVTEDPRYRLAAEATLDSLGGLAVANPHAQEHVLLAVLQSFQTQEAPFVSRLIPSDESAGPKGGLKSLRRDPVTYTLKSSQSNYRAGETGRLIIELKIDEGWYLYGKNPELDLIVAVEVEPIRVPRLEFGQLQEPEAKQKTDPILKKTVLTYEGTVRFELPFTVREDAQPGPVMLAVKLRSQSCGAGRCLQPEDLAMRLPIEIF